MGEEVMIGDLADRIGIQTWRLRKLADRGLIPAPKRLGRYRIFREGDIPAIVEAARKAGYLMHVPQFATA